MKPPVSRMGRMLSLLVVIVVFFSFLAGCVVPTPEPVEEAVEVEQVAEEAEEVEEVVAATPVPEAEAPEAAAIPTPEVNDYPAIYRWLTDARQYDVLPPEVCEPEEPYKLALDMIIMSQDYTREVAESAEQFAEEHGMSVQTFDANFDANKSLSIAETIAVTTRLIRKGRGSPGNQGANVAIFGACRHPVPFDFMELHWKHARLYTAGSACHGYTKFAHERAVELIASGRVQVKPLLTHKFPLEFTAAAFEMIMKQTDPCVKVLIDPAMEAEEYREYGRDTLFDYINGMGYGNNFCQSAFSPIFPVKTPTCRAMLSASSGCPTASCTSTPPQPFCMTTSIFPAGQSSAASMAIDSRAQRRATSSGET